MNLETMYTFYSSDLMIMKAMLVKTGDGRIDKCLPHTLCWLYKFGAGKD